MTAEDLPKVPALAIDRTNARRYHFAGGLWFVLADATATGGNLSSLEAVYTRGPVLPRRIERVRDELYFIIAGQVAVSLDSDAPRVAAEGAFVFVPRGHIRSLRVVSDHARIYVCSIPGGWESIIVDHAQRTTELGPPTRIDARASVFPSIEAWTAASVELAAEARATGP